MNLTYAYKLSNQGKRNNIVNSFFYFDLRRYRCTEMFSPASLLHAPTTDQMTACL